MKMIGKANKTIVNGTGIAWSEMGSGPALILIHGFQDTHRIWRRIAPLLANDFRVIMIDLPGSGLSDRPNAPYTLEWYSSILIDWMNAISIAKAHICGHSYGGGVAQWMLLKGRNRIERLALVSPGGLGREVGCWLKPATIPILGRLFTPLVVRYIIPTLMRFNSDAFGYREPAEIKQAIRLNRIPGTARAFQRSLEGVINIFGQHKQTQQRASKVKELPPIALFWGKRDPILPVQQGYRTIAESAGITLTTYECGHFPHLDAAATFAEDLKSFLQAPDHPSACFFENYKLFLKNDRACANHMINA